jgi:hypothetical protein
MSIKLINYDLINRRPQIGLTTGAIKTELRDGTAIEQLIGRQGLLKAGEQPTFYVAPYSKYINVDDLTNHAPEGTVLLATSSAQLYFGSPEVKAAIKTLMPLETQIPGYARGLFASGQSQMLDRPLRVLVVDHETGRNDSGIPERLIRNIAADGASIIDRSVGEQMKLIGDTGLSQVRGYSLNPQIGSYYIKGTVTPLNLQNYFASHGLDVDVDLILTTSMLKGKGGGKLEPQIGIHEVDPADLFITKTNSLRQTTVKLGSVQDLYAQGLAKDLAIPVQTAIQDLQQKQVDLISLAEDYVRTFKISQERDVLNGKPEVELPGNIAFIDTILESKNWGLLELPSVRANLQEYVDGQIDQIKAGAIDSLRGQFRPIVVCGELKHNQIAGVGLTTGDRHVALRFPVLNRGQVQAVEVNNDISFLLNPDLEAVIPDAIYVGRQTLAEIEQDDPQTYQQIIEEFGSVKAAQASWRTNLQAMKADFDGDQVSLFAQADYPNFYAEVVDNLTPEKLMHFVSKDEKQQIQSEDLPRMVVERLKDYVGIINSNLGKINKLYASLDFIIASTDNDLSEKDKLAAEQLKAETLQLAFEAFQKYRESAKSVVEPDAKVDIKLPAELQATFKKFAPFYSVNFLKGQTNNPRAQANYLHQTQEGVAILIGAYNLKSLVATPINAQKGIVLPPDLINEMEQVKFMKLEQILQGKVNPALLVEYLDNYASIHTRLGKIIDLSQPIESHRKSFNPETNEMDRLTIKKIEIISNYPYDPTQIDEYLRQYQTVVLRKCIEVVDKENQRSVDFVKSGVKPNEGIVYAVTDKLPDLDVGIKILKQIIIEENHQDRLPVPTKLTINALFEQLRYVPVAPEIKSMVASFRSDYQEIQSIIALETQTLKTFKHGKPIVLNIYTPNGDKVVVGGCNVSEINIFRQLEGKGTIDVSDGLVVFSPTDSPLERLRQRTIPDIHPRYVLGSTTVTSAQIDGKRAIAEFEFEILHDRIDELKVESREVLVEFRAVIEQRGWDKREVFAAAAQLVGEKSISQDFLLSCLPEVLNDYVLETGVSNVVVKTEYASYLNGVTDYMVTQGEDVKKLEARASIEGKQQWIEVGDLVSYGNQLLDKSTFRGSIEPSYNTVTFTSPNVGGNQRSVAVGKITSSGRAEIERSGAIESLQIIRQQKPSYRLKFEDIDIKVGDLAPAVAAELGDRESTNLVLKQLKIFDNKFSATVTIDDQTYYLSGVNASTSFEKKNRENVTEPIRKERFEAATVTIVREAQLDEVFEVYNGAAKIGEITQKPELAYWGKRFRALEGENTTIEMKVQTVTPKYLGYSIRIDENTLFNNNVWAEVAHAQSYQGESKQLKTNQVEGKQGEIKAMVIKAAVQNLKRVADANCYPQSFSVKVTVPVIDGSGLKEVEQLQLVVPNNKIDVLEKYFKKDDVNVKYTKLERGIPSTYEESRRAYTVLRVNLETLEPKVKGMISRQLGKPASQSDYEAKLATIPIVNEWTSIKLNSLKKWIEQYPQSKDTPVLDLDKSKPVPFKLKSITGEVQTRFKGKATANGSSILFEFVNERQRDTAMHHLGLQISAELPSVDGKTRYFAVVEAATLQTYLNDRAVSHVLIQDGVKRTNPILNSYSTSENWTKLPARSQTDIIMGYQASKYIGIPLEAKSRTTMYRDNWGANANATSYKSTDVVMVTGNRTGKETSNELLARHFRTEYIPLINAVVDAQATILVGADTGIDRMVKDYLIEAGYNLHLNCAGIYEASNQTPAVKIEVFVSAAKQEIEQEEEQEYAEMTM